MPLAPSTFTKRLSIRWADIDANFHMRHSVYYDFGAQQRMDVLAAVGLTMMDMQKGGFGPILFREECRFFKEVRIEHVIDMHVVITALSKDHRKFSFRHAMMNGEEKCAVMEVDGAWFDARTRKVAVPPQIVIDAVDHLPRSEDFKWID